MTILLVILGVVVVFGLVCVYASCVVSGRISDAERSAKNERRPAE